MFNTTEQHRSFVHLIWHALLDSRAGVSKTDARSTKVKTREVWSGMPDGPAFPNRINR